jgi:uncharacterized protein (TIGR00369 family)
MLLEPHSSNRCFGCGGANPRGMRLAFEQDDVARRIRGVFRVGQDYQGGPGFVHGGIVATLLDEVMAKVNRFAQEIAMTAELTVEYKKPVPTDEDLIVEGWEVERKGRARLRHGEIRDTSGALLARARGRFVAIDEARFAALNAKAARGSNQGGV